MSDWSSGRTWFLGLLGAAFVAAIAAAAALSGVVVQDRLQERSASRADAQDLRRASRLIDSELALVTIQLNELVRDRAVPGLSRRFKGRYSYLSSRVWEHERDVFAEHAAPDLWDLAASTYAGIDSIRAMTLLVPPGTQLGRAGVGIQAAATTCRSAVLLRRQLLVDGGDREIQGCRRP